MCVSKRLKALIALILLSLVIIIGFFLYSMTTFADEHSCFESGNGTAENPYKVSTVKHFSEVRNYRGAYFEQTDDIDFSNQGNFTPIGSITFPFTGHYNGGKYSIVNIKISSDSNNVGLFSFVDGGTIENLKVENASIRGEYNVGVIAGANRGLVIGCVTGGSVQGHGAVGGLVGLNSVGGVVKESGNYAQVTTNLKDEGGKYAGGIAGINYAAISDCYNRGSINYDATNESLISTYSGGLVGLNFGNTCIASVTKSYNIGKIGGNAKGQLVGDNINAFILNCKWLNSGENKAVAFDNENFKNIKSNTCLSYQEFNNQQSFNDWGDFNNLWKYFNGHYPLLKREYVEVEAIKFNTSYVKLQPGQSYKLETTIYPSHATDKEVIIKSENADNLIYNEHDNTISVSVDAVIGSKYKLFAQAGNKTSEMVIEVGKIPVERVELINRSEKTELSSIQSLQFSTTVYPDNASNKAVEYSVNSSYAQIDKNGVLTITENAPVGLPITVTVKSADDKTKLDSLTVNVAKVPVQSVTIGAPDSFKVTDSIILSAQVLPVEATFKEVKFEINEHLTTAKGAKITGNVLSAKGLGEVYIIAYADGVQSSKIISVLKQPVSAILIDVPDSVYYNEHLLLNVSVSPDNATFKDVTFSVVGENSANAVIHNNILYAKGEGSVIVKATADGISCEKQIRINKIPVESVKLNCSTEFKHTEFLELNVTILPENALYKDVTYELIDNTVGAYISADKLYAERPGEIRIRATADGVSDELTVEVLKESVRSIALNAEYVEDYDCEALRFTAKVFPSNATFQDITYVLKSGKATLSHDGLLLIDIRNPIGSLIEVYAIADGVNSAVYEVRSGKIEVKTVTLSADKDSIKVGEAVSLNVTTNPAIVSNPGVSYIVDGNGEIIDGELYVFDSAMVGKSIKVTAVVDKVESNTVSISVIKTPVTSIMFTCATSFKVTESLRLSSFVLPINATYKDVKYSVISDNNTGAEIIDNEIYAKQPGDITVQAYADGVASEGIIKVLKAPVTNVILTSATSVKVKENLTLTAIALPFEATYREVSYSLIKNGIGARIKDSNVLYSPNIGTVTLRLTADGFVSDYEIEILKEPVTSIIYSGAKSFKHADYLELTTVVNPSNATFSDVQYEILTDYSGYKDIGARIEGNVLKANSPGQIRLLILSDKGAFSTEVTIEVTKQPVKQITFVDPTVGLLNSGYRTGKIDIKTNVTPNNATYPQVTYSIVDSDNCTAALNGTELIVKLKDVKKENDGSASICQATVTVKAIADGVESTCIYTFNKYAVTLDDFDLISSVDNVLTDTFKTSETMNLSAQFSELVTYKEYDIEIDGWKAEYSADQEISPILKEGVLSAKRPGVVTIKLTSKCGGISKNYDINVLQEAVTETRLGLVLTNDITLTGEMSDWSESVGGDTYHEYTMIDIKPNAQLKIRPFAYAAEHKTNATFGDKEYLDLWFINEKDEHFRITETNNYFEYNENGLTIRENAPVTAHFRLYAKSQYGNIESTPLEVVIQSAYLESFKNARITDDGHIEGLSGIPNVEKISIKIVHSWDKTIKKDYNTNNPSLLLQLYCYSLNGYFSVTYTVYFVQTLSDGTEYHYSYLIFDAVRFNGIRLSQDYQTIPETEDAIVLLDLYLNAQPNIVIGDNIKVLYIYGDKNETLTTKLTFNNSANNTVDLYLDDFCFNAPIGEPAIEAVKGSLNLIAVGEVTIRGGSGNSEHPDGGEAISVNNTITISGDGSLRIYGGYGYNGRDGSSGEKGENGGYGAAAISAYSCIIAENHGEIYISGGDGGHGGNGGNGSNGGSGTNGNNGGNGGIGRDSGIGISAHNVLLNLNSNKLYIRSGNAGRGGNGGNGGNGNDGGNGGIGGRGGYSGDAIYCANFDVIFNDDFKVSISSGTGGQGGRGGDGGNAEKKSGTNGRGGNGGDSGMSGNGIKLTYDEDNVWLLNDYITIGAVFEGGACGANGSGKGSNPSNPYNGVDGTQGMKICLQDDSDD